VMKDQMAKTYLRPKIVSSTYGTIKRVLLVYWAFLDELNPAHGQRYFEENRLRKRVIKFYLPLITEMVKGRKPGEELHFDFLIESKIKLGSVEDPSPKVISSDFRKFQADESKALEQNEPICTIFCAPGPNAELNDFGNSSDDQLSYRPRRCYRSVELCFSYRLIFMNVDFKVLAYEAIRALDLNSKIFDLRDTSDIFYWIQDPFLVMSSGDQNILMEPFYAWPSVDGVLPPFNFKNIPEVISSQTSILLKSIPFYLQGGNILVGSNYAFIGSEVYRLNHKVYFEALFSEPESLDEEDMEQTIYRAFTKDLALALNLKYIFVIGAKQCDKSKKLSVPSAPRPLFHLDLFLTIGGRYRSLESKPIVKELILLGQIYEWVDTKSSKGYEWQATNEIKVPDNRHGKKVDEELNRVIDYLNETEKQLIDRGFLVKRLPILYWNKQYFHYNNCLVESSEVLKDCDKSQVVYQTIVYIPQFHWKYFDNLIEDPENSRPCFAKGDEMAKHELVELGFEVRSVDMNFRSLASSKVGLHCMTSILSRVEHPANPHPRAQFDPPCKPKNA
jgi:hypothetical protein